jgi:hypothetical protein
LPRLLRLFENEFLLKTFHENQLENFTIHPTHDKLLPHSLAWRNCATFFTAKTSCPDSGPAHL